MLEPAAQSARTSATGVSLHIGLNFLNPDHYAGWDGKLNACEFDAEDMRDLAERAGFRTTSLIREAATRRAVLDEFRRAASSLSSGDIFLITYSGHGGSIPDPSLDEIDGKDETWCLYDGQLVDDEIGRLWQDFAAGVRVVLISDSCHSQTIYRNLRGARMAVEPGNEEPVVGGPRAMPLAVAARTYRQNREFYDQVQSDLGTGEARDYDEARVKCSLIVLSGCMDNQFSYDGLANGQFTGELLRAWGNGNFRGSYRDLHRRIIARMPDNQSPQLETLGTATSDFVAQQPFMIG